MAFQASTRSVMRSRRVHQIITLQLLRNSNSNGAIMKTFLNHVNCIHLNHLDFKRNHDLVIHPKQVRDKKVKPPVIDQSQRGHMLKEPSMNDDYLDHYDETSELDYLADSITTHGSKFTAFSMEMNKSKELLKLSSKMKANTIRNRYFKPPKKPNVLTWACKERIRSLHKNDPEKWTIEELSLSFPVSPISISKILKSRVRLHRLEDIKQHDGFVRNNWETVYKSLIAAEDSSEVRSDFVNDVLSNIGDRDSILNALPLNGEQDSCGSKELNVRSKKMGGIFSSIVRDEIERQEEQQNILYSQYAADLKQLEAILLKIRTIVVSCDEAEIENKNTLSRSNYIPDVVNTQKNEKEKSSLVEISVSERKATDSAEFMVDGCVYDEHGDFLYKIPS